MGKRFREFSHSLKEQMVDEMAGANMNTRDVHHHLKKSGWNLTRSAGGHDVYTHPKSNEHIAVPRHKHLKAPIYYINAYIYIMYNIANTT